MISEDNNLFMCLPQESWASESRNLVLFTYEHSVPSTEQAFEEYFWMMNIWRTEDQTGQYAWANSSLSLILRRHPGLLVIPQGCKPTCPTQWKQFWKESNGESSFSKPFWHLPGTRPCFRYNASPAESVPVWDPLVEHLTTSLMGQAGNGQNQAHAYQYWFHGARGIRLAYWSWPI